MSVCSLCGLTKLRCHFPMPALLLVDPEAFDDPEEEWACLVCLLQCSEKWAPGHEMLKEEIRSALDAVDPARKFEEAHDDASAMLQHRVVRIAFVTGQTAMVTLPASNRVQDLKHEVARMANVPVRGLRLLLGGKEIKARAGTLSDQKVMGGAQLMGIMALSRFAGQNKIEGVQRDQYGNAAGSEYDLTVDGAFAGMAILVMALTRREEGSFDEPVAALKKKGFRVQVWIESPPSASELKTALANDDVTQLWVISDLRQKLNNDHARVIEDFWHQGGGLYLWGDNEPFFADANLLAERLVGLSLFGNKCGMGQVLQVRPTGIGLRRHEITTGLENMFEGVTVASVKPSEAKKKANGQLWETIINGSEDNIICAAYTDADGHRLILDGGFTRLYQRFWSKTAGTSRYVVNAAGWLVNFD